MSNQHQLLRQADILPTEEVLEKALGEEVYPVFQQLSTIITNEGLIPEWRYYNDGKAWLCKVLFKKKTVFWLSIWEGFIKTSFFFTEKNNEGVFALDVHEDIKNGFSQVKPMGKLIPLILDMDKKEQLNDLLKIIIYKKNLK